MLNHYSIARLAAVLFVPFTLNILFMVVWPFHTQAHSPAPQTQVQSSPTSQNQSLELEYEKLKIEKLKAWLTAGSILFPLLVAVITVYLQMKSALSLKEAEARTAFELKAAEIVLGSGSPARARGKAEVLAQLFPQHLPQNFSQSFDSSQMPGTRSDDKLEFLKMVTEHPDREKEIIQMWEELFPWDKEWLPNRH